MEPTRGRGQEKLPRCFLLFTAFRNLGVEMAKGNAATCRNSEDVCAASHDGKAQGMKTLGLENRYTDSKQA